MVDDHDVDLPVSSPSEPKHTPESEGVDRIERMRAVRDQRTSPVSTIQRELDPDVKPLPAPSSQAPVSATKEESIPVPEQGPIQREKTHTEPVNTQGTGWFDVEVAPPRVPTIKTETTRAESFSSNTPTRVTRSQTGSLPTPKTESLSPTALAR